MKINDFSLKVSELLNSVIKKHLEETNSRFLRKGSQLNEWEKQELLNCGVSTKKWGFIVSGHLKAYDDTDVESLCNLIGIDYNAITFPKP